MPAPLALAFWCEVMESLLKGEEEARLWLDTGEERTGFIWWCDVTDKDALWWRKELLKLWNRRGTRQAQLMLRKLILERR